MQKDKERLPDRMATAIFYVSNSGLKKKIFDHSRNIHPKLSNVPQGGATVFPSLNVSIFPKKGSALIWYNLDHKGDGDRRTGHSACPTIVGSRWGKNLKRIT